MHGCMDVNPHADAICLQQSFWHHLQHASSASASLAQAKHVQLLLLLCTSSSSSSSSSSATAAPIVYMRICAAATHALCMLVQAQSRPPNCVQEGAIAAAAHSILRPITSQPCAWCVAQHAYVFKAEVVWRAVWLSKQCIKLWTGMNGHASSSNSCPNQASFCEA